MNKGGAAWRGWFAVGDMKGLVPKFGPLTEKNEREFRSFFDKIIQLPFSMPIANYDVKV